MRPNFLPKGCDYQGRHPQAAAVAEEPPAAAPAPAEAATELGADDWECNPRIDDIKFLAAVMGACAVPGLIYLACFLGVWPFN